MDMKPVKSSSIDEVGHDPETQTLAVKFKNGGTFSPSPHRGKERQPNT